MVNKAGSVLSTRFAMNYNLQQDGVTALHVGALQAAGPQQHFSLPQEEWHRITTHESSEFGTHKGEDCISLKVY